MMRHALTQTAGMITLTALAACQRDAPVGEDPALEQDGVAADSMVPAAVVFDTATVQVRTADTVFTVEVEVADESDERAYGLMDRDDLEPNSGMIFLYDDAQPPESGFWMYRTRIPLDIAFFDSAGRIGAILQMEPCTTPDGTRCPTYAPGVQYFGALEVNRGFLEERGVRVGDQILLPGRFGD